MAKGAKAAGQANAPDASMRIVVLHGKDSYLRVERSRELERSLEEKFGSFDRFDHDGASASLAVVLDELRTFSLMSRHKLVIVDNAELFFAAEDRRRAMERYAESPMEEATLLLRTGGTWRPGNFDKLVAAVGAVIRCDAPSDDEAIRWCMARAQKQHRAVMDPDAATLLVDRIGSDLARLDSEMEKLAVASTVKGGPGKITAALVGEFVGLSREEQAWEIQAAILSGSSAAALEKLDELVTVSRAPEVMLAWSVTDLLRKLHGAAQLLARGESEGSIARALRLWGPQTGEVIRAARALGSRKAASLLEESMNTDLRMRQGLSGQDVRTLEGLLLKVGGALA